MEFIELKAEERQGVGKGVARKMRQKGLIPAILYGGTEGPMPLTLSVRSLLAFLHKERGSHFLINLEIQSRGGPKRKTVILKELQRDPIKDSLIHADFMEISLEKKIRVKIPIHLKGEPVGVKLKGGHLEHILREVEVEGLPAMMPDHILLDVSSLDIGDFLHVKDIPWKEGVRTLEDPEQPIAIIAAPKVEEEVVLKEVVKGEPELVKRKEVREEG